MIRARLIFPGFVTTTLLAVALLPLLWTGTAATAQVAASSAMKSAAVPGVLLRDEAAGLMPSSVFFAGRSATIQARNSTGFRFPGGRLVLASLVDTSGYSSGVQERYQAYLITEVPLTIGGKSLAPGVYGFGFVDGRFLVMDIAGDTLLTAPAMHDTAIARPTPLQILPAHEQNAFALYAGRNFVTLVGLPRQAGTRR